MSKKDYKEEMGKTSVAKLTEMDLDPFISNPYIAGDGFNPTSADMGPK